MWFGTCRLRHNSTRYERTRQFLGIGRCHLAEDKREECIMERDDPHEMQKTMLCGGMLGLDILPQRQEMPVRRRS